MAVRKTKSGANLKRWFKESGLMYVPVNLVVEQKVKKEVRLIVDLVSVYLVKQ